MQVGRPPKDVEEARASWTCPVCKQVDPSDPKRMSLADIKYPKEDSAKPRSGDLAKPAKPGQQACSFIRTSNPDFKLTGTKRSGDPAASKPKVPKPTSSTDPASRVDSSLASPWLSRLSAIEGHLQGLVHNVGAFGEDSSVEERFTAIEKQLTRLVGDSEVKMEIGLTQDSKTELNKTKAECATLTVSLKALSATIKNDLRPDMEKLTKKLSDQPVQDTGDYLMKAEKFDIISAMYETDGIDTSYWGWVTSVDEKAPDDAKSIKAYFPDYPDPSQREDTFCQDDLGKACYSSVMLFMPYVMHAFCNACLMCR